MTLTSISQGGAGALNVFVAWIGILMGVAHGAMMGLRFDRENWLGGYGSFKRRLYRLAHISFFGLAMLNVIFFVTLMAFPSGGAMVHAASWLFIAGAVTMPLCCFVVAHHPRGKLVFTVPVVSLAVGSVLTLWSVVL